MRKLIAGLLGAGLVLGIAPAMAGEWKLNPRLCYDLREDRYDRAEDRRDARHDYGRRDRREDRWDRRENRRDERVTVCPRSAWVYYPDRREIARGYDRDRGGYYGRDRHGRYARSNRYRQPSLTLSFDNNRGMSFRIEGGRRYYVRG
jgi:hypothetical protein